MRIVIASYFYSNKIKTEEELLEQHYSTTGWAEALQSKGAEVIVINRFHKNGSIRKNNVLYLFYQDQLGESFKAWQFPLGFFRKLKELQPDVLQLHHLSLSLHTFLLRRMLPSKTSIVVQHHGGQSPPAFKRCCYNLFNRSADAFFFTSQQQGNDWFLRKKTFRKIMPIMEGATYFDYPGRKQFPKHIYSNRSEARAMSNMQGTMVFLWVGRLDHNKDPVTVLEGFGNIIAKYPGAKLYMIYAGNDLEQEVIKIISSNEQLFENIILIGQIPHEQIEVYYQSADYFVLGSHYEGSGYALSEALRCGCVPVVTNIPAFKMMTDEGKLGALWEPGNKDSFVNAVEIALSKPLYPESKACINFFERNLSFDAIAEKAMQYYRLLMKRRQQEYTPVGVNKSYERANNS